MHQDHIIYMCTELRECYSSARADVRQGLDMCQMPAGREPADMPASLSAEDHLLHVASSGTIRNSHLDTHSYLAPLPPFLSDRNHLTGPQVEEKETTDLAWAQRSSMKHV